MIEVVYVLCSKGDYQEGYGKLGKLWAVAAFLLLSSKSSHLRYQSNYWQNVIRVCLFVNYKIGLL